MEYGLIAMAAAMVMAVLGSTCLQPSIPSRSARSVNTLTHSVVGYFRVWSFKTL
jgi:hypothetical protein